MKRELYVGFVAICLFLSGAMFSCNARAEPLTLGHFVAADDVMKETRTFRQAMGAVGGAWGAYAGYTAATAAGMSPVGVAIVTTSAAIVYSAALYGGSTAGMEFVVADTARIARERSNALTELLKKQKDKAISYAERF